MNLVSEQLNDALLKLREWLLQRQPRERLVLAVGAAAILCALCYAVLFAPLNSAIATRSKRIEQKQNDLAWMQSVAPQLSSFNANSVMRNSSGESMVVLVANTASSSNVANALTGQTPDGPNGVRVRFEGAQFDALVLWLSALQRDYGIRITAAEFNRTAQAGQVNASLSLQRSGS